MARVENKHGSVVEVDTSSMNGKTKSCLPRKAVLVPGRRADVRKHEGTWYTVHRISCV